jgi:Rad3-related DNA helicase
VEAFLVTLVDANDQGRIFIERFGEGEATNVVLKYQLLNPEHAFKQVVEDARAVVLAGGTMTPVRSSPPISQETSFQLGRYGRCPTFVPSSSSTSQKPG